MVSRCGDCAVRGDRVRLRLYILPVALAFGAGVAARDQAGQWYEIKKAEPKIPAREEVYRSVLCPPDWRYTITQEYLDRNRRDEITRRTRIRYCI